MNQWGVYMNGTKLIEKVITEQPEMFFDQKVKCFIVFLSMHEWVVTYTTLMYTLITLKMRPFKTKKKMHINHSAFV